MLSSEHQKIIDILSEYSQLTKNWDGNQGNSPLQLDLDNANDFLNHLKKYSAPIPMMSPDGEIGFYWPQKHFGFYIDLGFLDGGFSYYAIDKNGKEYFADNPNYSRDSIAELINILKQV